MNYSTKLLYRSLIQPKESWISHNGIRPPLIQIFARNKFLGSIINGAKFRPTQFDHANGHNNSHVTTNQKRISHSPSPLLLETLS